MKPKSFDPYAYIADAIVAAIEAGAATFHLVLAAQRHRQCATGLPRIAIPLRENPALKCQRLSWPERSVG